MHCKEFLEVSESYIGDELLIETNHQINHHLEHCPNCRRDFFARKNLRLKVRSAVRGSVEFRMDPAFSQRLNSSLKDEALGARASIFAIFRPWVLAPVAAALILVSVFGIGYLRLGSISDTEPLITAKSVGYRFAAFSADDHHDCTLEKLDLWESKEARNFPIKKEFAVLVERALSSEPYPVQILGAHDCLFEGRPFIHVIVKTGDEIVSVYMENGIQNRSVGEPPFVETTSIRSLQVASFFIGERPVSVVSQMAEEQNRRLAQILANSLV
jgi:hypothetical protein